MNRLLLIEDQEMVRVSLADELRESGFHVDEAADGIEAVKWLESEIYTAVITDLNLPGNLNGLQILEKIKSESPATIVLMITAFGTIETAVQAMKQGADDYLTKPFETEELLLILNRLIKFRTLEYENIELRRRLGEKIGFNNFIGESAVINKIKETLRIVAPTDETVLIEGETGTGKEVLARAIHENSRRQENPFVEISCVSIPSALLESELFGHEKGAFTGAHQMKIGRFEQAHKGTVFLDEVDDIPINLQAKLLRVLQEKEFQRIGGKKKIKADIRVVAATKKDLLNLVSEKTFREDLFYRLNVIPIYLPPIRDRRDDILPLIDYFLCVNCPNREKVDIEPDALRKLLDYDWPGNVRQLENTIKRMIILGQYGKITLDMIPDEILQNVESRNKINLETIDFEKAVERFKGKLILDALKQTRGNKTQAAKILGMKPSTFRDHLAKYPHILE